MQLTMAGSATVTQVDAALNGSGAVSKVELHSGAGCGGALLGTVASPGAGMVRPHVAARLREHLDDVRAKSAGA